MRRLTGATLDEGSAADAPSSVLTAAAALLHEDYSSVRQGNSNWMLHVFLDTTAKMLAPIVAAYDRRCVCRWGRTLLGLRCPACVPRP